uniref:Uncharacterized protein n=1 Tax=Romanomermis culicivorax TaxID=13658 RepID=A0A915IBS5_ROMCU
MLCYNIYRCYNVARQKARAHYYRRFWVTWNLELQLHTNRALCGVVRNISPELWKFQHLTALFLCNNNLHRLPSQISALLNLQLLDLSNNKLRSLPAELGDMISLKNLYLNNNQIRILPYEIGKLFRLVALGLSGNPLTPEIAQIYREQSGTQKLLQFLLDHLTNSTYVYEIQYFRHNFNVLNILGNRFNRVQLLVIDERYRYQIHYFDRHYTNDLKN